MQLLTATPLDSPARVRPARHQPLKVGVVQHRWRTDGEQLRQALAEGVAKAAEWGAQLVVLPELTLSRYPAF